MKTKIVWPILGSLFVLFFSMTCIANVEECIQEYQPEPSLETIPETIPELHPEPVLTLDIPRSFQLVLSAERRMGSAWESVSQSDINLELAESQFDIQWTPKGDAGYIGGDKAGDGITVGTGVEIFKKFNYGTRLSFQPSFMKASHDYNLNLRVMITQPLLRGFGKEITLLPIYGAQYACRNARRTLYQTQIKLMLQTVQGLYEIIKLEVLVKLDTESFDRLQKFCISTKMKEQIGLCDALDVYRAQTELKIAEDTLNQSLERLQDAKDNLRDTLALPLDMEFTVNVPIEFNPVDITFEEAVEAALTNRVEMDQAKDQLSEKLRLVRVEKRNTWPDLNFVADYSSFSRDEFFTNSWTNKRESKWGFGFTSAATLETGAYEQSLFALAEAERNLDQVHDNIILEVKRTLRTLNRASEKIETQEEQIHNAQKEYHFARVKFEHGRANNFDLIQAEKNLRAAQTALIGAIIEHKINEFRLLASLGTLADKPWMCQ